VDVELVIWRWKGNSFGDVVLRRDEPMEKGSQVTAWPFFLTASDAVKGAGSTAFNHDFPASYVANQFYHMHPSHWMPCAGVSVIRFP
jgi:hypothetical protein